MRDEHFQQIVIRNGIATQLVCRSTDIDLCANSIVVEPEFMGVCSSDLKELKGKRFGMKTFGHEVVGRILENRGCPELLVGDMVVYNPTTQLASTSGFTSRFVVTSDNTQQLRDAFCCLPRRTLDEIYVFAEPLSCAVRTVSSMNRVMPEFDGKSVGIVGSGLFAYLLALQCSCLGMVVTLIGRTNAALDFYSCRSEDPNISFASKASREAFDAVIVSTPEITGEILLEATELVRGGGLIQLFGGTRPDNVMLRSGLDIDEIRRRELSVVEEHAAKRFWVAGSHGAGPLDLAISVQLLSGCRYDHLRRMIVGYTRLSDGADLINQLARTRYLGRHIVRR